MNSKTLNTKHFMSDWLEHFVLLDNLIYIIIINVQFVNVINNSLWNECYYFPKELENSCVYIKYIVLLLLLIITTD